METALRFKELMEFIRDEIGEVTVQQLLVLAYVAANEGCSQVEIANALDMPEPTVSRNIAKLSGRKIKRKDKDGNTVLIPGKDILTKDIEDADDFRRNYVRLTPKGKRILRGISRYYGSE